MKKLLPTLPILLISISAFGQVITKNYTQAEAYSYNKILDDYSLIGSNYERNKVEIIGSNVSITSQNGKKKTIECEWKYVEGIKCLVEGDNESIFVIQDDFFAWFFIYDGTVHQSMIIFR
ncbi:MAG: hypothetical protein R2828_35860 [Saprospiraceae bacterium]